MQFRSSVFAQLMKPISREAFRARAERLGADAYDKSFGSWDHLVALIYAQLSGARSLRALEAAFNAHAHHHYHLGTDKVSRSTLSDANARRPAAVFMETFEALSGLCGRTVRREGAAMLRLIDSSPVPLGAVIDWASWNGRIRGMKLHVVYDPQADVPKRISITSANVNDIEEGKKTPIEKGATYVFDKGYCDYGWWTNLHDQGAVFVTRAKSSMRLGTTRRRGLKRRRGDGFAVVEDCEVKLASKGDSRLAVPLRRIKVERDEAGPLVLLTNDMKRSAVEIAALYKARWDIELLFRWIKQHLKIKAFLGRSENAVRLQIIAAMIAYLLLRIVARQNRLNIPAIRFVDLVAHCLFHRKPIARIERPPDVNPSKPRPTYSSTQMEFALA